MFKGSLGDKGTKPRWRDFNNGSNLRLTLKRPPPRADQYLSGGPKDSKETETWNMLKICKKKLNEEIKHNQSILKQ